MSYPYSDMGSTGSKGVVHSRSQTPPPAYGTQPPAYSNAPPPAQYNAPAGFNIQYGVQSTFDPGARFVNGQPQSVPPPPPQAKMATGSFDAGARWVNGQPPTVPPPPPGYAPNAAQAGMMQGQSVVVTQQRGGWLEGGSNGGYVLF